MLDPEYTTPPTTAGEGMPPPGDAVQSGVRVATLAGVISEPVGTEPARAAPPRNCGQSGGATSAVAGSAVAAATRPAAVSPRTVAATAAIRFTWPLDRSSSHLRGRADPHRIPGLTTLATRGAEESRPGWSIRAAAPPGSHRLRSMLKGGAASADPLDRVRSLLLAALTTEVLLLVLTGVALYFVYRPTDTLAWDDIRASSGSVGTSHVVRLLHRLVGYAALLTALPAAVVVAVHSPRSGRETRLLLGGGLLLTAAAALYTGFLLPWDHLALWAVTVGTNLTGYQPILSSQVRFVIIANAEVSPAAILTVLIVHALLGGPAAGLLLGTARRGRRSPRGDDAGADPRGRAIDAPVPAGVVRSRSED